MSTNPYEHFKRISVSTASDLEAVVLLYNEAVNVLKKAEENFSQGNEAFKENIEMARKIIQGLRSNLDFKNGGEIAKNLSFLYSYFDSRLLVAKEGVKTTSSILTEIIGLLSKLRDAWITVAENEKRKENIPLQPLSNCPGLALEA